MKLLEEKKYEFRNRMRCVHAENIRNTALHPDADEIEIKDGWKILLPTNCGEVCVTAAKDFLDYLFASMNVSVSISKKEAASSSDAVVLKLDESIEEDYIISVGEGINVTGKNERGLAQGLYCLEDKMSLRKAPFIKREEIRHRFLFSPRMVHSGYALDHYPDQHLAAIAHAGMDAILVFVKGINLTPSGFLDFNELISRAAKYGIDVYAYSYLKSEKHPEDEGAQEFYDNLYGTLFEKCPGFRGVIFVGESVGFPSRDPHVASTVEHKLVNGIPYSKPRPGFWPCCDFPQWLECVKKAIYKHKADADIVFWTYNWGYVDTEERLKLIRSLPTDISLMATFEMFETYQLGSFKQTVADYSLAFAGPGHYFSSEAKAAKERGIRLYAMSNTGGLTWDIGTIPYEPMPYQWMKRYEGLREANEKYGLCGLMESHHYGFWPSFIGDLAKQCFIAENADLEANLINVLRTRFGDAETEKINEALKLFSEAIRCYTPSDADQYGAFRCGPSYPLCLVKEVKPEAEKFAHFGNRILEVLYPADYSPTTNIPCGRGMLPNLRIKGELESLNKMLSYMREGVKLLKEVENPNEELLYLINLGEYICCCIVTGINAKKWYVTTTKMRVSDNREEVQKLAQEAKAIVDDERKNAEIALELVKLDSRLGWEPSMDYIADAERIEWKLRHLDYVRETEIGYYEKGSDIKWES